MSGTHVTLKSALRSRESSGTRIQARPSTASTTKHRLASKFKSRSVRFRSHDKRYWIETDDENENADEDLTNVFGPLERTPSQYEFFAALYRKGFSLHLLLLAFFAFWYLFVITTHRYFFYMKNPLRVRCVVPELEKHFDNEQVIQLSLTTKDFTPSPYRQFCYYNDWDYEKLMVDHDYNFTLILEHVKNSKVPKQKKCKDIEADYIPFIVEDVPLYGGYKSIVKEYKLVCNKSSLLSLLIIAPTFASIVCAVPFGMAGDLYGRKPVVVVSLLIEIFGLLLMFIPSIYCLFAGQVISGIAGFMPFMAIYTIFSETCNTTTRLHLGVIIFSASGFSNMALYCLYFHIRFWKYNLVALLVCMSVSVFIMWYVDESARWLFYTGQTNEAWGIMENNFENVDVPTDDEENETDQTTFWDILRFYRKPTFKTRIILTSTFAFLVAAVATTDYRPAHVLSLGRLEYHLTSGLSEIISTIMLYCLLLILGRRSTIFIIIISLTVVNLVIFVNKELKTQMILSAMLMLKLLSYSAICCIFFQVIELYPTRYRFSAEGFIVLSIEAACAFTHYYDKILNPKPQSVTYTPLFMFSVTAWLLACFLPESSNRDLPDLETEALLSSLSKLQQ